MKLIASICCAVLFLLLPARETVAANPPNVVILLADDLGWADVSYHGGYVRTPHIDSLAKDGVELDRFYVCPMCSPTRAATMTGRYPIRFGLARAVIPPWRNFGLDVEEQTIADLLADAGYRHRGIFGKWHLGHHHVRWHPLSRGFSRFLGHYNGAIDYFSLEREGERDWHSNFEPSDQQGYSTDLIAEAASRFISEAAKDGPFFCYVPFNAPHSPFQAPQKYLDQYSGIAPKNAEKKKGRNNNRTKQTLAAMITCMDDGIGRILDAIDEAGVADNTIVWFFSDNGGIKAVAENNLPLRGNKLSVFEGGIRVPACVRWPAKLKSGKVSAPLSCMDVLPTVAGITGAGKPNGKPLDGVDVLPVLTGKQKNLRRDLFFYHGQSGEKNELNALTTPEWKLIILGPKLQRSGELSSNHQRMLFAIAEDPLEKNDVSAKHPTIVAKLARRMAEFRQLQPVNSVDQYNLKKTGYKPPAKWRIPGRTVTK